MLDVKIFLFTDSLCITKSIKKNVPLNTKNNPLELVTLIKWKSLSTGQKIEINCPDDQTIILSNPKKVDRTALFFDNELIRLNWFKEIEASINNYFSCSQIVPEYMRLEELSTLDISEYSDLEFQINSTSLLKVKNFKNHFVYHLELHRPNKPYILINKFFNSFTTLEKYVKI